MRVAPFSQIEWVKSTNTPQALFFGKLETLFGDAIAIQSEEGLIALEFIQNHNEDWLINRYKSDFPNSQWAQSLAELQPLQDALNGKAITVKIQPIGTDFQISIWQELTNIAFGETTNYSEIARKIQKPQAARAVASAIAANPIALFIPCHRVNAKSGALTGFRWGIPRKSALQAWERDYKSAEILSTAI